MIVILEGMVNAFYSKGVISFKEPVLFKKEQDQVTFYTPSNGTNIIVDDVICGDLVLGNTYIHTNNGVIIGDNYGNISISQKNGRTFINGEEVKPKSMFDSLKEKVFPKKEENTISEYKLEDILKLKISGMSSLKTEDILSIKKLDLSGTSKASFSALPKITKINMSGTSSVSLSTSSDDVNIDCSGTSNIELSNCLIEDLEINCSGMSNVVINDSTINSIDASCSGMSKVSGRNTSVEHKRTHTSGMAKISL